MPDRVDTPQQGGRFNPGVPALNRDDFIRLLLEHMKRFGIGSLPNSSYVAPEQRSWPLDKLPF
jgi:hypothetical protein